MKGQESQANDVVLSKKSKDGKNVKNSGLTKKAVKEGQNSKRKEQVSTDSELDLVLEVDNNSLRKDFPEMEEAEEEEIDESSEMENSNESAAPDDLNGSNESSSDNSDSALVKTRGRKPSSIMKGKQNLFIQFDRNDSVNPEKVKT